MESQCEEEEEGNCFNFKEFENEIEKEEILGFFNCFESFSSLFYDDETFKDLLVRNAIWRKIVVNLLRVVPQEWRQDFLIIFCNALKLYVGMSKGKEVNMPSIVSLIK